MKAKSSLVLLAASLLFASCSTPATLGYLRDMEYNTPYTAKRAPDLILQPDDVISIHVYSPADAELAEPFNMGFGAASARSDVDATSYTIDKEGFIDFPTLGKVLAQGLTMDELKEQLIWKMNNSGYIKDPLVKITISNFKITVLGEMTNSIMEVNDNSINLLQVVARSGGTPVSGKIHDVMVIRTQDGVRTAYAVNLQSKDLFDSPAFYLCQNDIVYLKPKGIKVSQTGETITSAVNRFSSLIQTIMVYALLFVRK